MKILTGKEIRIKRIEYGVTTLDLCNVLEISRQWLSAVENGKVNGEPTRLRATLYFNGIKNKKDVDNQEHSS